MTAGETKNHKSIYKCKNALNYRYIELLLTRRTGIKTIWAKDGLQALNVCKDDKTIDIVLLDLQLPEMDGLNALLSIKKVNPFLPVIIQTANSWNNEEEMCNEAGCDGFFNKPLNIEELLTHMDNCLKAYSSSRHVKINS